MKIKLFLFAILLFSMSSCGSIVSKLYIPVEANALKASLPVQDLITGKNLYLNNCNECHGLKMPKRFDAVQWTKKLDKMQDRAEITDAEKALIHAYLTSEIRD